MEILIQYAEFIYTRWDKKQNEDIKNKNLATKTNKMSNTDLTKKPRLNPYYMKIQLIHKHDHEYMSYMAIF